MEILDTTQACYVVDDDLLNFTLDGGEGEKEVVAPTIFKGGASASSTSLDSSNPAAAAAYGRGNHTRSFPEFVEEELEWLSNKDAFPAVETCFGILSDNPELISNHQSPVSVLENSTISSNNSNTNSSSNNNNSSFVASCCNSLKVPTSYPVRARTKRSRRRRDSVQHSLWLSQVNSVFKKNRRDISFSLPPAPVKASAGGMGRRCLHCQADKTPQWRAGPMGPKTLCNACGVRYKSGRLLPEYRPANSPTFSSVLHSNSHRKVVEMRRRKQVGPGEGITVNVAASCGYSVG
ncbi:gata transcription factor 1 [Phtheirospermum japonicum]|uniref:Gata transcription factor 1 n=1 Tax=Phtheirospermum japonicum TaxID=374723 RepID=A0A830DE37_9LAMI|nr:gata transcription factor 1 [Phtheirospermum japonicum]